MNKTRIGLLLLVLASCIVYGIQLVVFKDVKTTAFYILQDIAFLPISIAIATIVVGDYLTKKEKKERMQKTQMIKSAFFTEFGSSLLQALMKALKDKEKVYELFEKDVALDVLKEEIASFPFSIDLTEKTYQNINDLILDNRDSLLVIASNPLLLDHEEFTSLIWSIFHLIDEVRLRGNFQDLSAADRIHLNQDYSDVCQKLFVNWIENLMYTKQMYPSYYSAKIMKLLGEA